jgi:DNA repair protein RadC
MLRVPPEERPRERLLRHGAQTLSDGELVAVLLRTGGRDRPVLDLARDLLAHFGGLPGLAAATAAEVATFRGIGPGKAALLGAAAELAARVAADGSGEPPRAGRTSGALRSSGDVYRRLRPRLARRRHEIFLALLLNARNQVLREEVVARGTVTDAPAHPREAFAAAVREGAAGVIFAHNHPSGDPSPSPADIALTHRLVAAGELLGIPVLDHVIIAREGFVSLVPQAKASARSWARPR